MGEYPRKDAYGDLWLDPSGFTPAIPPRSGKCFKCDRFTNRMDLTFMTWFCDSKKCNDAVRRDLEEADAKRAVAPQEAIDFSLEAWESEGGNGTHNR